MRSAFRLTTSAAALLLAVTASAAGTAHAAARAPTGAEHVVFVQTDGLARNQIVAYHRANDGTLTFARRYDTAGQGGALKGAVADKLASQGSLVYDSAHALLYAVNARSNSVSVFGVHGDRLALHGVVGSGGNFPVSLAVHGDLVYALNALGAGELEGYRVAGGTLRPISGSGRSLGLGQSPSPDSTFLYTPGQVGFSPDGSQVIVTTKSNGSNLDVFNVGAEGRLSRPVLNRSTAPVPFGFTFDPAGRVVVGEAGTSSVSTYTLNTNRTLTPVGSASDGQAALCWITPAAGNYYVSNTGSGTVSGYHIDASGQPTPFTQASADPGPIDSAASVDGSFLYVDTGVHGNVDSYRINTDGTLSTLAAVPALGAGIEGIVAV
jgi:DNA-binding beta-propeller fold protein YncE